MPTKGAVKVGDVIVAKFEAESKNVASSTVQVTFADDNDKARSSGECAVPAGGSGTSEPEVRATAAGLVTVLFRVPAAGSGVATVLVNGAVRSSETINATIDWDYDVS